MTRTEQTTATNAAFGRAMAEAATTRQQAQSAENAGFANRARGMRMAAEQMETAALRNLMAGE